ncbi:MAG: nuclear transport factor 2 family protein [Chloroflexi bacterium]|nr:nuclear transport factor 2 family protein [Chloroflexota bacterium]
MASDNLDLIERFCQAFKRKNPDEILAFFTDDAVYHNMPLAPARGNAGIRNVLEMFLKPSRSVEFVILNIAASGDVVLTERVDKFAMEGRNVELPVAGVFEVKGGKIAAWRDYFDMATWTRQTTGQ